MKTKKILSLVLAMVMALALAVPAFAAVSIGDKYDLDASSATISVADTNSDSTDDEWSITLAGQKGVLTTQTASDGDTADATAIAEWVTAVSSSFTGWTVSSSGTTVTFTATAANATVPAGATPQTPAGGGGAGTPNVTDLAGLTTGVDMAITGTTEVPTISVIVPTTGAVVCNPYKLTVQVSGTDHDEQIISAVQYISSASTVPLKVNITGKATPANGVTMATKAPTEKTTDKQVYLYVNTKALGNLAAAPATAPNFDAYSKTTALLLGTADATLSGVELAAKNASNESGYMAFRLEGAMTTAPTTAWAAADTVGVALKFTFTASAIAE